PNRFLDALPFRPTGAQRTAIAEIAADMARPVPMNRLLQGEVGSGKTVVALWAALAAVNGGYQAAVMAPTEVLAAQHELTIRELIKSLDPSPAGGAGEAGQAGSRPAGGEVQLGLFHPTSAAGPGVVLLTGSAGAARR